MPIITQPTEVPPLWLELRREAFDFRECKTRQLAQRRPLAKNLVKDLPAQRRTINSAGLPARRCQSTK